MLTLVPIRRKSAKWVLGLALLNILQLIPWVAASWALSQIKDGDDQTCFGPMFDYLNYSRIAFAGLILYQIAAIPFNLRVVQQRKHNRESRLTPWLTMLDLIAWAFNFGLWIYAIVALANRDSCPDNGVRIYLWLAVFISVILFSIVLVAFMISLLAAIFRLKRDLESRGSYVGYAKGPVEVLNVSKGADNRYVQGGATTTMQPNVEVVDVRRSQPMRSSLEIR